MFNLISVYNSNLKYNGYCINKIIIFYSWAPFTHKNFVNFTSICATQ